MDIRELILYLRRYESDRAIQRETGLHRKTVKRYREWATQQGLLSGPMPTLGELEKLVEQSLPEKAPPQNRSSLEGYQGVVSQLRKEGVEVTAILQRLKERGYTGSYSSVRRYVRKIETKQPEVMVRVECKPGEEAQVDFGYAGEMLDPTTHQPRRAWAFVMTLSWSRHQYVEFVFDQKINTWLLLHRHAFEWFGGVPHRVVIDNLKAAIVKACFDEPVVQQAYRECAEHYGFLIAPCRVATPRHKGKVESGVHYVKRNFLGGREVTTLTVANEDVRVWCNETAGRRVHGTTKEQPLQRFTHSEQRQLNCLPPAPYDLAIWKTATVGADGHITFENAYYSVPFRMTKGTKVRVRGGAQFVTIFTESHEALATHDRAQHPGQRLTHPDHLPQHKVAGLTLNREECRQDAAMVGNATEQMVTMLLADKSVDRLRTVGRLLRLRQSYGDERLELACQRALQFDAPTYTTVKRILAHGLDVETPPPDVATPPALTFARAAADLLGHLFGGQTWN
jgi:transposase